jgi:hypothetical protein
MNTQEGDGWDIGVPSHYASAHCERANLSSTSHHKLDQSTIANVLIEHWIGSFNLAVVVGSNSIKSIIAFKHCGVATSSSEQFGGLRKRPAKKVSPHRGFALYSLDQINQLAGIEGGSGSLILASEANSKSVKQKGGFDQWEKLGLSRVKSDLESTGGIRDVGGTLETRDWAWKWVAMKERAQAASTATRAAEVELTVISAQRIEELRTLNSTAFDSRKLIRLCKEINTA